MTVNCLQILRVNQHANENDGWSGAKTMLSDIGLKQNLINFSTNREKINKIKASQIKNVNDRIK